MCPSPILGSHSSVERVIQGLSHTFSPFLQPSPTIALGLQCRQNGARHRGPGDCTCFLTHGAAIGHLLKAGPSQSMVVFSTWQG